MIRGERADASAVEAEQMPSNANPLLPLISLDPHDQSMLIDEVRQLSCSTVAARWVDELLDDPRLAALPKVRDAGVRALLKFGHPHALLINPEHLEEYRKANPSDIRPWRLFAGAAIGCLASMLGFVVLGDAYSLSGLLTTLVFALGGAWAFSVAVRTLWTRRMTRVRAIGEVVAGLAIATAVNGFQHSVFGPGNPLWGWAVLTAVIPVALAGLSGAWAERY